MASCSSSSPTAAAAAIGAAFSAIRPSGGRIKSQIPNPKLQIPNVRASETQRFRGQPRSWDLGFGIWDLGFSKSAIRRSRSAIACSSIARCAGAQAHRRSAKARVRASESVARSASRVPSSGLIAGVLVRRSAAASCCASIDLLSHPRAIRHSTSVRRVAVR
jgi:hypothetical protein